MSHRASIAFLLALCVGGSAAAFDREADLATAPVRIMADSPSPSDLQRDQAFGSNGSVTLDYNVGSEKDDHGLRVVNKQGRYFVLGRHERSDGNIDATISRIDGASGALQKSWRVPTGVAQINDAAVRNQDSWDDMRIYFVGARRVVGPTLDFAVFCVRVLADSAGPCNEFGSNGLMTIPFDLGGGYDDIATRVHFRTAEMWVAGTAQRANNTKVVAVAKIEFDPPRLDTGFGTGGKWTRSFGGPRDVDVEVRDLMTDPVGSRLYIAGRFEEADSYGYVLAIDRHTAAYEATFGGDGIVVTGGGANCISCRGNAVTAIRPLPNGHLLMAGWGMAPDGAQRLVLHRLKRSGDYDPTLCGWLTCVPSTDDWGGSRRDEPVSIDVRNGWNESGDIVVAMTRDYAYDFEPTTYQSVHQYPYSQPSTDIVDYPRPVAHTNFIGWPAGAPGENLAIATASDMLLEEGATVLVGTNQYDVGDHDVMVSRMRVNNSIFASSFGYSARD